MSNIYFDSIRESVLKGFTTACHFVKQQSGRYSYLAADKRFLAITLVAIGAIAVLVCLYKKCSKEQQPSEKEVRVEAEVEEEQMELLQEAEVEDDDEVEEEASAAATGPARRASTLPRDDQYGSPSPAPRRSMLWKGNTLSAASYSVSCAAQADTAVSYSPSKVTYLETAFKACFGHVKSEQSYKKQVGPTEMFFEKKGLSKLFVWVITERKEAPSLTALAAYVDMGRIDIFYEGEYQPADKETPVKSARELAQKIAALSVCPKEQKAYKETLPDSRETQFFVGAFSSELLLVWGRPDKAYAIFDVNARTIKREKGVLCA